MKFSVSSPKQTPAPPSLAFLVITVLLTVPLAANTVADDPGLWAPSARLVYVNDAPVKSGYFCLAGQNPFCGNAVSDFGAAVAVDGDKAVVGNPHAELVYVYERIGAAWVEAAVLEGPSGFGSAVAISGDTIVVGRSSGSEARVYERSGENGWDLTGTLTAPESNCLGWSVDVQGGRVAVGDPCASRIHLFQKVGGSWTEDTALAVDDVASLGRSVALDGDHIATASAGGAHLFEKEGTVWSSTSIFPDSTMIVDLSGDTLALATQGRLREVFVFERSSEGWSQSAKITGEDISPFEANERFASSLALSGDTLAVGAERDDPSSGSPSVDGSVADLCDSPGGVKVCVPPRPGAVYVYDGSGGYWSQTAKLVGDPIGEGWFGAAVAISPDEGLLVVGAPYKLMSAVGGVMDVDPENAVHIFTRGV